MTVPAVQRLGICDLCGIIRPVTFELRGNGLVRLFALPDHALSWMVPLWATLCGAVASGGLALTLDGGVRLLLTLLLVEVGWGTLWTALATTDWAAPLRRWQDWPAVGQPAFLPYTRPDSPGGRLARWLAQLRSWWREAPDATVRRALAAVTAALLLSLILAAVLGANMLLLTLVALALMQLALVFDRGRGRVGAGWDGALRLGLPWLAGHLVFAALALPATALAAAFSASAAGIGGANRPVGRALWAAGQLAAALLFLPLQRPLAVPFLALLLLPQLLLMGQGGQEGGWIPRAWPWLAASMLLAAWAL